jgi:hypothetical protein
MSIWKIAGTVLAAGALGYGALTAAAYWTISQPLERFGAIMRHVPGIAMAVLPFERIWMRVRAGTLQAGDEAPDFTLPAIDRAHSVTISEEYRSKPVVLIFGSYT